MRDRVYDTAILVGSIISAFLFAAFPAYNAWHEENQFPCGRREALVCQSANEIFAGQFLSLFPLAIASYLLAYFLVRRLLRASALRWFVTSIFGTVLAVMAYSIFRDFGDSFGDWNMLAGTMIWTVVVTVFMLPFMAFSTIAALIYDRSKKPKLL